MQNKANFRHGQAGLPPKAIVQNEANFRQHADREIGVPGGLFVQNKANFRARVSRAKCFAAKGL